MFCKFLKSKRWTTGPSTDPAMIQLTPDIDQDVVALLTALAKLPTKSNRLEIDVVGKKAKARITKVNLFRAYSVENSRLSGGTSFDSNEQKLIFEHQMDLSSVEIHTRFVTFLSPVKNITLFEAACVMVQYILYEIQPTWDDGFGGTARVTFNWEENTVKVLYDFNASPHSTVTDLDYSSYFK